jgi:hypothetical protein
MINSRNDVSSVPTSILLLTNIINLSEIDFATDPKFFYQIREEVKEECGKYGVVENVLVESSAEGNIWVKYVQLKDAKVACEKLNNRNFNGRQILSSFAKEDSYLRRMVASSN